MARRIELARLRRAQGWSQEGLAGELGVSRNSPYRWERGDTTPQPELRPAYARLLGISLFKLDALLGAVSEADKTMRKQVEEWDNGDDAMIRREFFRLAAVTSALLTAPDLAGSAPTANQTDYDAINGHLWRVYARASAKSSMYPAVTVQVNSIRNSLNRPQTSTSLRQLCAQLADTYQLAGEIAFDSLRYDDAVSSYLLAGSAAKEAQDPDLWACAMTRHALACLADDDLMEAEALLDAAARIARRGDSSRSSRHWVAAVQAETYARTGNTAACLRALDCAEEVRHLTGPPHTGWLRFTGSRIAEERGACLVLLGQFDQAEVALTQGLTSATSPRRQAAVLADLAALGIHRNDVDQVAEHTTALLNLAGQNNSGYITNKLNGLRTKLMPLRTEPNIRDLYDHVTAVTQ